MKRHTWQYVRAMCVLSGVVLSACSGAPDGSSGEEPRVGTSAAAITASDAIKRAEEWVAVKLPYCQSANHQPDGDTSCSPVCTRPDNPAWDDYRSDCSGLLSYAWGLPAPGRVTWEFAPAQTDISKTINAVDLAPGDAVNKPHDHTMLFKAWITPGQRATFIEEPGCSSATPYAHEFDSDVTISGTSITVAHNGITFDAIHFVSLEPPVDAGPPDTGAADAGAGDAGQHDGHAPDTGSPPDPPGTPGEDAGPKVDSTEAGAVPTYDRGPMQGPAGCAMSRIGGGGADPLFALPLLAVPIFARARRRRRTG